MPNLSAEGVLRWGTTREAGLRDRRWIRTARSRCRTCMRGGTSRSALGGSRPRCGDSGGGAEDRPNRDAGLRSHSPSHGIDRYPLGVIPEDRLRPAERAPVRSLTDRNEPREVAVMTPQPLLRRKRRPRVFAGALSGLRLPRRRRHRAGDPPRHYPFPFSLGPSNAPDGPEAEGGVGVREPRGPKPLGSSGAAALPIPESGRDT